MVCELLDPAATVGKLAVMGVAESCGVLGGAGGGVPVGGVPVADGVDPFTTPAHPLPIIDAASTTATTQNDILFRFDLLFFMVWQV
jgi:hypothetical protein